MPGQSKVARPSTPRLRGQLDPELKKLRNAGTALYKLATAALQKSNERMAAVTESSRDAYILFNQRETIIQVNAAFEQLFGYGRSEVTGQSIRTIFPDGLAVPSRSSISDLSPQDWRSGREVSACRKDGTRIQMTIRLAPINTPQGMTVLVSISDLIRRRVQIEDALYESEERLRLALFSTHVAIWEWNVESNELTWSPTGETIFGIEPEQIRRYENFAERVHPRDLLHFEVERDGGPKGIGLSVMDNGSGFDAAEKIAHHKGLGLASMHERLRYLNGHLRIHSRPADGTKVCAWVPSDEGG